VREVLNSLHEIVQRQDMVNQEVFFAFHPEPRSDKKRARVNWLLVLMLLSVVKELLTFLFLLLARHAEHLPTD